jgi:hypothetical protein
MSKYIISNNCSNNCSNNSNYCRDTSSFLSKLASKLMDMAIAINTRIENIKKQVNCPSERGVLMASIDAPVMAIAINIEYIEYIKRYGPPEGGKFDTDKLNLIKNELGITEETRL